MAHSTSAATPAAEEKTYQPFDLIPPETALEIWAEPNSRTVVFGRAKLHSPLICFSHPNPVPLSLNQQSRKVVLGARSPLFVESSTLPAGFSDVQFNWEHDPLAIRMPSCTGEEAKELFRFIQEELLQHLGIPIEATLTENNPAENTSIERPPVENTRAKNAPQVRAMEAFKDDWAAVIFKNLGHLNRPEVYISIVFRELKEIDVLVRSTAGRSKFWNVPYGRPRLLVERAQLSREEFNEKAKGACRIVKVAFNDKANTEVEFSDED